MLGVVLAGGRSSRMGADKAELVLDGQRFLERAVSALGFCESVVVVAPARPVSGELSPAIEFVLESPPFGGPVAGIAAAIESWHDEPGEAEVFVLPVDTVEPGHVTELLLAASLGADGVVLRDTEGWPQFLLARYRLGSMRRALNELGESRDVSMRRFGSLLELAHVDVSDDVVRDVDTPEQARQHGITVRGESSAAGKGGQHVELLDLADRTVVVGDADPVEQE